MNVGPNYPYTPPKVRCRNKVSPLTSFFQLFLLVNLISPIHYIYLLFNGNKHMKVYHPNLNEDGAVCLNILRLDWTPTNSIKDVLLGLLLLMLDPGIEEPLNKGLNFFDEIKKIYIYM